MRETSLEQENLRRQLMPPSISLRDLFIILFKWQWTIILVLLIVAMLTMFWLTVIKSPVYEASAKLMVKIGNEQSSPPTLVGGQVSTISYRSHDINSEVEILSSYDVLGEVVDHFGMDKPEVEVEPEKLVQRIRFWMRQYKQKIKDWINERMIQIGFRERLSPREQAIFSLSRAISVIPKRESYVIFVNLTLPARVGSSQVLNKLIDVYLEKRRQIYQDAAAVGFFEKLVDEESTQLRSAERKLVALEKKVGISDIGKQKELLLNQIGQARHAVAQARMSFDDAASRLARLELEIASENPRFAVAGEFEPNSFPESIMLQLADLLRQKEQLRAEEGSRGLRTEVNQNQFELLLDLLVSNLQAVTAERKADLELARENLASLTTRLDEIKAAEITWRGLNREIELLEKSYQTQREKLNESNLRAALVERQLGNVVMIQEATDPLLAKGMRKAVLLVLIMVITVFGLMTWIAIAEFFDHRFYTPESLESELDTYIIGVIPDYKKARPIAPEARGGRS